MQLPKALFFKTEFELDKRNFGIDLLRTISIWMVLIQHLNVIHIGHSPLVLGSIGVEIFFVVSGFLIGGIILNDIDKGNSFYKTIKFFLIKRWFRILPLYYFLLLFKFLFIDDSIGVNTLYYVFFLQNNFYNLQFYDVTWSLVIEEWFYLFAPVFLFAVIRCFKNKNHVLLVMIALLVFVNVLRLYVVVISDEAFVSINNNVVLRIDSLFLGVIMAYGIKNNSGEFLQKKSLLLFVVGIVFLLAYLSFFWNNCSPNYNIDNLLFPRTIGFFILPFSISLLLPFVIHFNCNRNTNLFSKMFYYFITITGTLTYSIYLIHQFIFELHFYVLTSFLFTYALAFIAYVFFEKPIIRFRDKLILQPH